MDWRDDILSGLPSPRDDEPASLRRDIEDELADHLACALNRERTTTDDESAARRAVLARFGSPRLVACKLYWDAMKGKIMKDRLMIAALLILTLASLAALGLSWTALQQSNRASAAIAQKLDGIAAQIEKSSIPPNQSILKLQTVVAGNEARPLAGVTFRLLNNDSSSQPVRVTTDQEGRAKLNLRPGDYMLLYPTDDPDPFNPGVYCLQLSLKLFGGEMTEQTVPVPPEELKVELRPLKVALDWPVEIDELTRRDYPADGCQYRLACWIHRKWIPGATSWRSETIGLVMTPRGEVEVDASVSRNDSIGYKSVRYKDFSSDQWRENRRDGPPQLTRILHLQPGEYEVLGMSVLRYDGERSNAPYWNDDLYSSRASRTSARPSFTVSRSGESQWRISLPDDLKGRVLASMQPEAVLEIKNQEHAYFHNLGLSIYIGPGGKPNVGSVRLDVERRGPLQTLPPTGAQRPASGFQHFDLLREGQTVTYQDYQFTVEKIVYDADQYHQNHALIRARRLPRPAAAPVTTSTQTDGS